MYLKQWVEGSASVSGFGVLHRLIATLKTPSTHRFDVRLMRSQSIQDEGKVGSGSCLRRTGREEVREMADRGPMQRMEVSRARHLLHGDAVPAGYGDVRLACVAPQYGRSKPGAPDDDI